MKEQGQKINIMHNYGDCSRCGGEVLSKKVELDYRYKGKLYIFRNVPAGVCQQCGEKYLTSKVAKNIESRLRKSSPEDLQETVVVPVLTMPDEIPV